MKNPQELIGALQAKPYNFKLKGTGPVDYLLGCHYNRDDDGILCQDPSKYIERMRDTYIRFFGEAPPTNNLCTQRV